MYVNAQRLHVPLLPRGVLPLADPSLASFSTSVLAKHVYVYLLSHVVKSRALVDPRIDSYATATDVTILLGAIFSALEEMCVSHALVVDKFAGQAPELVANFFSYLAVAWAPHWTTLLQTCCVVDQLNAKDIAALTEAGFTAVEPQTKAGESPPKNALARSVGAVLQLAAAATATTLITHYYTFTDVKQERATQLRAHVAAVAFAAPVMPNAVRALHNGEVFLTHYLPLLPPTESANKTDAQCRALVLLHLTLLCKPFGIAMEKLEATRLSKAKDSFKSLLEKADAPTLLRITHLLYSSCAPTPVVAAMPIPVPAPISATQLAPGAATRAAGARDTCDWHPGAHQRSSCPNFMCLGCGRVAPGHSWSKCPAPSPDSVYTAAEGRQCPHSRHGKTSFVATPAMPVRPARTR